MIFQRGLVQLEGLFDLDLLGVVDLDIGFTVGFEIQRFESGLLQVSE